MSENSQSLRKRSSLKTNNSLFPQEVDKKKSKRMSVNWNVDLKNLNYQEMKISQWDVSNVENMNNMFYKSPLEKNPPKWYKKK